jgi:glycosyltransferase involved in cell wall biosynthesis
VIRNARIDVVVVNGLANPHAGLAAHLEDVPVVWQLIDTFTPMAVRRPMMSIAGRIADAIMSTGQAVAEQHPGATAFGKRLVLFFPVVDPGRFVNDPEARRSARVRLGVPEECVVVGNVGNINPMKGHDTFVEAAALGRRLRPGTRFVILGAQYPQHARYADRLWRRAAGFGLRLGEDLIVVDPGSEVQELAAAFDVFWLTSHARSEGIPTVVGEAMALGLPVVATRVGSVHEAIDHEVTGHLVAPRDPVALVEATLPYLDDHQLRLAVGRTGRDRAQKLYSPEACAEQHLRAFELAIAHRRARR